jgi:hypothetical protein
VHSVQLPYLYDIVLNHLVSPAHCSDKGINRVQSSTPIRLEYIVACEMRFIGESAAQFALQHELTLNITILQQYRVFSQGI